MASFWIGVIPPKPMLWRSELYVQNHRVAYWTSSVDSNRNWASQSYRTVRL